HRDAQDRGKRYQVGPDVPVGLLSERSEWMVVAILAVLKAGGTYVPIDPAYPAERIAFMLADAGVRVLLTDQLTTFEQVKPVVGNLPAVISLQQDGELLAAYPVTNPARLNAADDLAYIIYTSGSTGQPKGAMIEHRNVVSLFCHEGFKFDFNTGDVWTLFHSFCFDFSVWELFGALFFGGQVVIVPREIAGDPDAFIDLLSRKAVTVLNQVPSMFSRIATRLLSHPDPPQLALRYVIFGGEALQPTLLRPWHERYPRVQLVNMYGITETTVHVTYQPIGRAEIDQGVSNIGRPIPSLRIYLLDEEQHLVPEGVAGEIAVGGAGVSRGYLNQPELTAQRFIADPFRAGERLYRSGDLGRRLPDGNLEYLGRMDQQVKLRGYRIELGELENRLMQQAAVKEAVAKIWSDQQGNEYLVAYLTAHAGQMVSTEQIRTALSEQLPAYMVPGYLILLEQLPLTANGKLDRRALPDPSGSGAPASRYVAPRTTWETRLTAVWRQVLGHDRIGTTDNFFELGGHSLKAIQLMTRIQQELGVKIGLSVIFANPTIAKMASVIGCSPERALDPIEAAGYQSCYDVSHAQRRIWMACLAESNAAAYNLPGAYVLEGDLNAGAFSRALQTLVERHESLRTTFITVDSTPKQKIHGAENQLFSTGYTDLRHDPERMNLVTKMAGTEAVKPFDLAAGPLLRAHLVRLEERKYVFLLTMHHIISDAWSMGVFLKEVVTLYNGYAKGQENPLEPLRVHYKDYALWERNRLTEDVLREHRDYWVTQFRQQIPPLQLPLDFPRPALRSTRAAAIPVTLDAPTTAGLRALCKTCDATAYAGMLTLLEVLLYKITGQPEMIIGSPIAAREHPDLEKQIGLYLNVMPLRISIDGQQSFTDALKSVARLTTDAFSHHAYPFDRLVEEINWIKDPNRPMLFDVGFTWQNAEEMVLGPAPGTLDAVMVSSFELPDTQVKTDIWFTAREEDHKITITIAYNLSLFRKETIEFLAGTFRSLVANILEAPAATVENILSQLPIRQKEQPIMASESIKVKNLEKFFSVEKRTVNIQKRPLVSTAFTAGGQSYPLVVEPAAEGLVLHEWVKGNQEWVKTHLLRHGAILFRNFPIHSTAPFQEFVQSVSDQRMEYFNRTSPRSRVEDKLYTSTDYPSDQTINMHNELSYSHSWPMQIIFFCLRPAQAGGETPIADSRRVLEALPHAVKEKFREKGVLYVRNMSQDIGLSWRDVYQTDDPGRVEAYCRTYGIGFEWGADDHLRISWKRPAILNHPVSGEPVWFNHGFFYNIGSMDSSVKDLFKNMHSIPFSTYYGDGEEIEPGVIEGIRLAYEGAKAAFTWRQGDILLLDNMLMAHGRNPFVGERKIVVAMNEPFEAIC
ncbi:MAG: amino acid adenylation domain-containing protein, partial [Cytophagales bacterium]|nr:amino acid adenylation domain-containing protein [Cytophagales bacterium]